jgi:hypothetical protein
VALVLATAEKEGIGCVEKRGMIMEFVVAWPEFCKQEIGIPFG